MRTSIVVLAGLLTAATAHAEKVGIVVTGEASLQPLLSSQLERWLHDRGRTFVPGALEPDAIGTLIDCFVLEDLRCARGVVEARAQSRSFVFARAEQVANQDGTRDISVTAYWFQKAAEPVVERRVCKQCTDAKLFETVDALMLTLVASPPVGDTAPATTGTPTTTAAVAAVPAADEADAEQSGGSGKLLAYGLIGVGAAALIGGGVMFAIDEDPDPTDTTSPTYRDSGTTGVILGAAGAITLGVGIALWFRDRGASRPVAAVSHDGAVFGWTGSF